jgi:hypothetical protein
MPSMIASRARWAAGDVGVYRDDFVDPSHYVVTPLKNAARDGAASDSDHEFRFGICS